MLVVCSPAVLLLVAGCCPVIWQQQQGHLRIWAKSVIQVYAPLITSLTQYPNLCNAALADADPLGVNQNVTFDEVGGLDDRELSLSYS